MRVGICAQVDASADAKAGGFEFLEPSAQLLLEGQKADSEWRATESALPTPSANLLVPAWLKIVGPEANPGQLREYMSRVVGRAKSVGISRLVFGSGGARRVPEGFDRDAARQQIIAFARDSAELARHCDLLLVVEPLHRGECNIINTLDEAMEYVHAVNHPNFRCLFDSYHFWMEDESVDHLCSAVQWVKHVHLADKEGRAAPGESRGSDYRPLFRILRDGGYDGMLSVEASMRNLRNDGPRIVKFIENQWSNC